VKGILDGSPERKPYEMGGGKAQVSVYNGASIVFDPFLLSLYQIIKDEEFLWEESLK